MLDEKLVIVCQGPPRCELEGDEAVKEQESGCPFCERIYIDEFGNERIVKPTEA